LEQSCQQLPKWFTTDKLPLPFLCHRSGSRQTFIGSVSPGRYTAQAGRRRRFREVNFQLRKYGGEFRRVPALLPALPTSKVNPLRLNVKRIPWQESLLQD